jgi:alkylated DNA repair dioxygenase AlkB
MNTEEQEKIYLTDTTWYQYYLLPNHLQVNNNLFEELWKMHPEEFHQIKIFGKVHNTPRWQKSYGKDYVFSGNVAFADNIPDILIPYLDWANHTYQINFNQILINWYNDGKHYIGMHSDDEEQLIKKSPVMGMSLGAPRKFVIHSKDKEYKNSFIVENNSVYVMGGTFQKTHKHGLPKQMKVKDRRISITFRQFK